MTSTKLCLPRTSALAPRHRALGSELEDWNGMGTAWSYHTDPDDEHDAVRECAGMFDMSGLKKVRLRGADAAQVADHVLSRDLSRLGVGQSAYGAVLVEDGGVCDDAIVYNNGDEWLWVHGSGESMERLQESAAGKNVDVVFDDDLHNISLQGPKAAAFLNQHVAMDLLSLEYFHHQNTELFGHSCLLSRTGYSGERGYEIFINAAAAVDVWDHIAEKGAAMGIMPCSFTALDKARIEAALLFFGYDMTAEHSPFEVGLGWAVSEVGEYRGKAAALARKGRERFVFAGLEIAHDAALVGGEKLFADGLEVGVVNSPGYSRRMHKSLALVHIRADWAAVGTQIRVVGEGVECTAAVAKTPFYDPQKVRTHARASMNNQPLVHATSVDQSDRRVPYNLRQSGATPVGMLISTRIRKSPFWHLSMQAGCWRATVYNRMYQPFGYVRPEDGGAMVEYAALKNHVTLWNVAVERQIMVKGVDAEAFVDYVITRDATLIAPMQAKYVILCNTAGGVLNDPVLLRVAPDEFWFSLADSDMGMYLQGVNHDKRFDVVIDELDICPVQIQGKKSLALMRDLVGAQVDMDKIPYYGLVEAAVGGFDCIISQTGFSGEAGYEIYLRDATLHADGFWHAILAAGKKHNLMVTAPPHCRRIQAGILSWGQDMDNQHNPFQCNLGYQVSLSGKGEWKKRGDYIGRDSLEKMRADLAAGKKPYRLQLVGLVFGGKPVEDFANDFWLVSVDGGTPCGFITSPWYHPDMQQNIGMGYVPFAGNLDKNNFPIGVIGQKYKVHLPDQYANAPGVLADAEVVRMPFTPSYYPNIRDR